MTRINVVSMDLSVDLVSKEHEESFVLLLLHFRPSQLDLLFHRAAGYDQYPVQADLSVERLTASEAIEFFKRIEGLPR
jgi:hypothetical protein